MILQKKKRILKAFRMLMVLFLVTVAAFLFQVSAMEVHAQGTAVVEASSGKIRKTADTESEVLASVKKGDKLDVAAQTTSANGYTWYKVYVDGNSMGYIRADLVSGVTGTIPAEDAASSTAQTGTENTSSGSNTASNDTGGETVTVGSGNHTTTSNSADPVTVNPSLVTAAKVVGSSVRVRASASTGSSVKGNAQAGAEVSVSGEVVDADGMTWYQVSFTSGNGTVTGFIRSDFLEVTQTQQPAEEEIPQEEEPVMEPETPLHNEYELKYEMNQDKGEEEWFLYENEKGTKKSLADILNVVSAIQNGETKSAGQVRKYQIALIIMAALILALVVAVTVLLFKVKDIYEEEDDEEEEERTVSKRSLAKAKRHAKRSYFEDEDDEEEDEEDDEEDDEPVIRKQRVPKSVKETKKSRQEDEWQSKNFLEIDDDMEFEFLDLK